MLEKIWSILPIVMIVVYLFYYNYSNLKVNFIPYLYFAIFPFFAYNENGFAGHKYIYTYAILYFSIFLVFYAMLEILAKGSKIKLSAWIFLYFLFLLYIVVNGLLRFPTSAMIKGLRNITFFSLAIIALYYLIGDSMQELKKVAIMNVIVISGSLIFQYIVSPWHDLRIMNYVRYRCFFNDSNSFAAVLLIYLFFATEGGIKKRDLIYLFLSGLAILFSWSSSGAIAFLIWVIDFKRIKQVFGKKMIYRCIFTIIIGLLVFLIVIRCLNPSYYNNLFKSQDDRMVLWAIYINAFMDKPIFGHGYTNVSALFGNYMNDLPDSPANIKILNNLWESGGGIIAHNDLLRILADTGIIGFVLFIVFLSEVFKCAYRNKDPRIIKIVLVGLVYLVTHNYIQGYIIWIMLMSIMIKNSSEAPSKEIVIIEASSKCSNECV